MITQSAVPVLLVPAGAGSLVFPSAMVSEVLIRTEIHSVPGSRVWVSGYCVWRGVPVSVVSLGMLLGLESGHSDVSRLVVMYPLPGRNPYDYFAIATASDPHSAYIDGEVKSASKPTGLRQRYVASLLDLPQGLGVVPDFQALKATFYS